MRAHTHAPQTPHCLDRPNLEEALKQAEEVPLRDVPADARLASEHVSTLQSLGGPSMLTDLYTELRTVRFSLPLSLFTLSLSLSTLPLSLCSLPRADAYSISLFLTSFSLSHTLSHTLFSYAT